MRVIRFESFGGPEVLVPAEVETAVPAPGEVLVRVAAASVNFKDIHQRHGMYGPRLPFVPGMEAAGTVEALGAGVEGPMVGDRVACLAREGCYAEFVRVPAGRAVPIPAAIDFVTAAASMVSGLTAHYLTQSCAELGPGSTVVVHGAAGGTNHMVVQMAVRAGARVIATASTPRKFQLATRAGSHVVLADVGELVKCVHEETGGRMADVVYDAVGRATFETSLAVLRPRGKLVLYGQASGPVPPFDVQRLGALGSLSLQRPSLAHYTADEGELRQRCAAVLGGLAEGSLFVHVDCTFPLAEAACAHAHVEGRASLGKVVLLSGPPLDQAEGA